VCRYLVALSPRLLMQNHSSHSSWAGCYGLIERPVLPLPTILSLEPRLPVLSLPVGVASDTTAVDRSYLVQAIMMRADLARPEAEARVDKAFADSGAAVLRARRGAVILAFMIGASLMIGAVVAWLAAAAGGKQPRWLDYARVLAPMGGRSTVLHSIVFGGGRVSQSEEERFPRR
jgi:hypothetical protein